MAAGGLYIAVPAAVTAAAAFGLAGVLQHRATKLVPGRGALQPSLLVDLARQPIWLGSVGAMVLGLALQLVALAFGPLVLVQPLLVTGLMFAVLIGSLVYRYRPDRIFLLGVGCCVIGLAGFLLVARPSAGEGVLTLDEVLPLAAGLAGVLGVCLSVASRRGGESRALALALATGVLYGVTAGLMKLVVRQLEMGVTVPFGNWPLYAVCIIGPMGFLLNQNAFQAETVVAPALAMIITVDPLVGIGIGRLWLGEQIRTGPLEILAEVLFLAVMAAGIYALAHRAPRVVSPLTPTELPSPQVGVRTAAQPRRDRARQRN